MGSLTDPYISGHWQLMYIEGNLTGSNKPMRSLHSRILLRLCYTSLSSSPFSCLHIELVCLHISD